MAKEYKIGDIVEGKVSGIEKYGIFVRVDDEFDGLIHISEVSTDFVRNINDYVEIGDIIYCQIIDITDSSNHLKLSIKNINYKTDNGDNPIKETRKGFLPLKENLDIWINEQLEIYKNNGE